MSLTQEVHAHELYVGGLLPGDIPMSSRPITSSHPSNEHIFTIPDASAQFVALPAVTKLRKVVMTSQLCGINFCMSVMTGMLTVCLPVMAADLALSEELYFWPLSVYGLAAASTMLPAGSLADLLGHRAVDLAGSFCIGIFMLASGFVKSGNAFVALRALLGVAASFHLSASVGVLSNALPRGRARNIAFSCLGLSPCLGYSVGLVLGGVLAETVGWRTGCYLCGGLTLALSFVGLKALPKPVTEREGHRTLRQVSHLLAHKIDWIGAAIGSTFMALSSYLLAVVSADINAIRKPESIVLLLLSAVAAPAFGFWMHRQVKLGRPAIIPNVLWRNTAFSSVCATVALSSAVIAALELFASLFFQNVQHLGPLDASLRLIPSLIVGAALNLTTGMVVDKISPVWLVLGSSILCAGSPLLLAVMSPDWTYWSAAFFSQILQPFSADVMFTVGLIVISEVFPEDTQALAGGVFNTASQFGQALGLAIMQVVSTLVAKKATEGGSSATDATLAGYRATYWTMFAFMISCALLGTWGLRKTSRVGLKTD